jgi:hypothetical protein
LKFRAGELEFNATIAEASEAPSPQTGDILRTLTIQLRAQKAAMHEQLLVEAEARRAGGVFSLSDTGEAELEWRVRASSFNYVGTEPWGINHHVWLIEQVERLAVARLLLGPIELVPYDYAEAVSDDSIVRLAARASISQTDLDTLSMNSDVVPVRRVGISDITRRMTLTYLWADQSDGLAVLVRCVDVREPQLTLDSASVTENPLADLVTVLTAKGILTSEDEAHLRRVRHAARRVANIGGWPLTP